MVGSLFLMCDIAGQHRGEDSSVSGVVATPQRHNNVCIMRLCAYILGMFACLCFRENELEMFLPGGLPLCCTSLSVRACWMLYVRLFGRTELKQVCLYILFAPGCSWFREH